MSEPVYNSIQELLDQLKTGCGHTFADLDVKHRLTGSARNDKGVLGKIVEEGVYHYSVNSRAEADFANLGVELKTSGFNKTRNGLSFKERIPLNTFNYQKVEAQAFEDSDMWHKCQQLLIALYEYLEGKPYGDMVLQSGFYHTFSQADIEVIKSDYNLIQNKIKSGVADTISERDTNYLAACTAGPGHGKEDRTASDHYGLSLKPRKFALKPGYMTGVLRRLFSNGEIESVVDYEELKTKTIEEAITDRMSYYVGKDEDYFKELIAGEEEPKNRFERYAAKMLGIKGIINDADEFVKANIICKTIRVEENGNIEQNMSFPAFSFLDVAEQEWEDSDFREMMINRKFMFVIFIKINGKYQFSKVKFWSIPEEILDNDGRKVFEELKAVLLSGNIVRGFKTDKNGKVIRLNNFPKSASNPYIHIRPHGLTGADTNPLPVPDKLTGVTEYTKQCFWLKKTYVLDIINKDD